MDWSKIAAALIPLLIGALGTVAWQNSHKLTELNATVEAVRIDLATTKTTLEPGKTIMLRFDQHDKEIGHLRALVEDRLSCRDVPGGR